jgi:hypothetical protein
MIGSITCPCKGTGEGHTTYEFDGKCKNSVSAGIHEGKFYLTLRETGSSGSVMYSYMSKEDALMLAHELIDYAASK